MDQNHEAQLGYSCRFAEKEECYYLRISLFQEVGHCEDASWYKNIDVVVISPGLKVNPLRSSFIPEEGVYKTEKEFKMIPKNHQPIGKIEVLLLVGNQAIYHRSFDDISQLLL